MPAWLKKEDEGLWSREKAAALKTYKETDPKFYAIVTSIFKKMGGRLEPAEAHEGYLTGLDLIAAMSAEEKAALDAEAEGIVKATSEQTKASGSMQDNPNTIKCRASLGVKLGASEPWQAGNPVSFIYAPSGQHTITAGFRKDETITISVVVDEPTAPVLQEAFDHLTATMPRQEPYADEDHEARRATLRFAAGKTKFSWGKVKEDEGIVISGGEPTGHGAKTVNDKDWRSWSPEFTTDADMEKAVENKGHWTFPDGVRGSESNPARLVGVNFVVGALTNRPAFRAMPPVKAKLAQVVEETVKATESEQERSEAAKRGWELRPHHIHVEDMEIHSRRLQVRRVNAEQLGLDAINKAKSENRTIIKVTHGGSVNNSYGYPAETEAAVAVAHPSGKHWVGIARLPANKVSYGGAFEAVTGHRGLFDDRFSDEAKAGVRQRFLEEIQPKMKFPASEEFLGRSASSPYNVEATDSHHTSTVKAKLAQVEEDTVKAAWSDALREAALEARRKGGWKTDDIHFPGMSKGTLSPYHVREQWEDKHKEIGKSIVSEAQHPDSTIESLGELSNAIHEHSSVPRGHIVGDAQNKFEYHDYNGYPVGLNKEQTNYKHDSPEQAMESAHEHYAGRIRHHIEMAKIARNNAKWHSKYFGTQATDSTTSSTVQATWSDAAREASAEARKSHAGLEKTFAARSESSLAFHASEKAEKHPSSWAEGHAAERHHAAAIAHENASAAHTDPSIKKYHTGQAEMHRAIARMHSDTWDAGKAKAHNASPLSSISTSSVSALQAVADQRKAAMDVLASVAPKPPPKRRPASGMDVLRDLVAAQADNPSKTILAQPS